MKIIAQTHRGSSGRNSKFLVEATATELLQISGTKDPARETVERINIKNGHAERDEIFAVNDEINIADFFELTSKLQDQTDLIKKYAANLRRAAAFVEKLPEDISKIHVKPAEKPNKKTYTVIK